MNAFAEINLEIKKLNIENGQLSIPFDPLINEYTVILDKEVSFLDLNYEVEEGVMVVISSNHDLQNNDVVTIRLEKENKNVEYHLQILKEEVEVLEAFLETPETVEFDFMREYKIYIIPFSCFFLILVVYKILFHKSRKKKHKK